MSYDTWLDSGNPLNDEHNEECTCKECHWGHKEDMDSWFFTPPLLSCCEDELDRMKENGEICPSNPADHLGEFMRDGVCIECDPDFKWCGECGGFGEIEKLLCEFCEGKGYIPNQRKVVTD